MMKMKVIYFQKKIQVITKMSAFTFEEIPLAKELNTQIDAFQQQKIEEQEMRMNDDQRNKIFAIQYNKIVKEAVCKGIQYMKKEGVYNTHIYLPRDSYLGEDGPLFSEVHENKIKWNPKYFTLPFPNKIFSPLFENLFKDIQIELSKKGYYLLKQGDFITLSSRNSNKYLFPDI